MLRSQKLLKAVKFPALLARYQSTAEQAAAKGKPLQIMSSAFVQKTKYIRTAFGDLYPDTTRGDIDMSSCDYLNYALHPYLNKIDGESIIRRGRISFNRSGCYVRPPASSVYRLEDAITEHTGGYQTCFVNSGTEANVAIFQAILENRPELPIYLDKFSHATMVLGANAAGRSDILTFKHNRLDHLRKMIDENGPGLIGVDSVYSAYGTVAPLEQLTELTRDTGSILLVDESHTYGICGEHGEGVVKELGLEKDVHVRTMSTGKALGAGGGAIVLNEAVGDHIEDIRKGTRMSIFSLAPQDCIADRLLETLRLLKEEKWKRTDLYDKIKYFRESCMEMGYNGLFVKGETPIITFVIGPVDMATEMYKDFVEKQIFPSPHVYPASPRNRTAVRFTVCHGVTYEQLNHVLDTLRNLREKYKPETWVDAQGIDLF
ncbi:unnamed protein product [Dimorphilus gyrociliatus]|uniref:Aminotransferase class I/classII large domain-containing protein n=1 Tax=Dimorphilus gyrociliatus TaxID=2664684 RepID=A0A7I8W987_9ANNE|nr:unnamed protein product [Dimorphilus gyrociliatus]